MVCSHNCFAAKQQVFQPVDGPNEGKCLPFNRAITELRVRQTTGNHRYWSFLPLLILLHDASANAVTAVIGIKVIVGSAYGLREPTMIFEMGYQLHHCRLSGCGPFHFGAPDDARTLFRSHVSTYPLLASAHHIVNGLRSLRVMSHELAKIAQDAQNFLNLFYILRRANPFQGLQLPRLRVYSP
jgi:hypothetical protein